MRKGSDLIGKRVIAFDTGEAFERVEDLIFDQNTNTLLGFLVDEGGWLSSANVIALENVRSIGPDALIVPSKNVEVRADQIPEMKRILEKRNTLRGTKMMTTDGRDLGTLIDLYFDEKTGVIEGYEVSGGVFADAYSGRSFVPAPQTIKIGEDVAFVPPETADLMEEQVGGIKAAVQTAGERIQETTQQAQASLTNATVDPSTQRSFVIGRTAEEDVVTPQGLMLVAAGQVVTPLAAEEAERQGMLDKLYRATGGSITGALGDRASSAFAGANLDEARGRRVQQAVRTDEGLIIAAPGQIVTDAVINRARTYHKEQALLEAVGLSASEAARSRASAVDERVREGASGLWERVKSTVSDTRERTAQEVEEQRIKHALGRPTNRVILDLQDNVLLNVGEIITHQAVDRARQAGVLDILLSSVYDKEPDITKEEMRAPESGSASLEQRTANQ